MFAAKILAGAIEDSLKKLRIDKENDSLSILGIPRWWVIVADIIVSKLSYNCEFDLITQKKLTAPHNQEITYFSNLICLTREIFSSINSGVVNIDSKTWLSKISLLIWMSLIDWSITLSFRWGIMFPGFLLLSLYGSSQIMTSPPSWIVQSSQNLPWNLSPSYDA